MSELIELQQGNYKLKRVSDGAGDCGPMLFGFGLDEGGNDIINTPNGSIKVGFAVECGSVYARTTSWQDYWMTTPITEILEINDDKSFVRFKTKNSEYTIEVI